MDKCTSIENDGHRRHFDNNLFTYLFIYILISKIE